jgi:RNA polymerase sigma-70 factor (ECF subfamily)
VDEIFVIPPQEGGPLRSNTSAAVNREDPGALTSERLGDLIIAVGRTQDRAAFKILFQHFAPRLKAFVMRQGTDAGLAEEVVQETFVNVWRRAAQFQPEKASASTWIFTVARNMRIDMLRKARRPEPDVNDLAFLVEPPLRADETHDRAKDAEKLRMILTSLPAEQQTVLQMVFFEDKPHSEVAEELGIPLGTVKSRIRLAVRRVRSELGERQ